MKDDKIIEVLDWLLEEKNLPTGIPDDFYEDKIIICDGTYYWDSDKDGDHPMMGKDVMAIYNKLKSQTPSPTGDRDCEELKEAVNELCDVIESLPIAARYHCEKEYNKAKQLLNKHP